MACGVRVCDVFLHCPTSPAPNNTRKGSAPTPPVHQLGIPPSQLEFSAAPDTGRQGAFRLSHEAPEPAAEPLHRMQTWPPP